MRNSRMIGTLSRFLFLAAVALSRISAATEAENQAHALGANDRVMIDQVDRELATQQEAFISTEQAIINGPERELATQQQEEVDSDVDGETFDIANSRALAGNNTCAFNLRKLANKVLNWKLTDYQLIRDPRNKFMNTGVGPSRFYANKLPLNFTSCQARKDKALTFFTRLPAQTTRRVGGCIGHFGTHVTEIPLIVVYDCNANIVACEEWGTTLRLPKQQDLLMVMYPGSNRRVDAFWFYFQFRKQASVFCDYYPF